MAKAAAKGFGAGLKAAEADAARLNKEAERLRRELAAHGVSVSDFGRVAEGSTFRPDNDTP